MRDLASGVKDYEKYRKIFREKFVFLNVYCQSVADEHDPRGPEGPYRFKDRSVPVLLFKRWDGETHLQQLGFVSDPEQARRRLAQYVDRALKKNGPIHPPKALRPLLKGWGKASDHLAKQRYAPAIRELQKIVKAGAVTKKFPEGPPPVALDAAAKLEELTKLARERLEAARAIEEPKEAKKALNAVRRDFGYLPAIKDALKGR